MFYISTIVLSLLFTFKKMYLSSRYLLVHHQTFSPVVFRGSSKQDGLYWVLLFLKDRISLDT